MTGPGPGKIPLKARVHLLGSRLVEVPADVYLHVKGYSLARVTHLDIEDPLLNKIIPPSSHKYLKIIGLPTGFRILLKNIIKINVNKESILVNSIDIHCSELSDLLSSGESTIAYVGGKNGGIFIGFKKMYVEKLEKKAIKMGVRPL
ncbi:MAG: hypothetical protein DRJ52_00315 [Thermoprotei archaeon]|nr:MAG: hypothetical protein DRJ52_00315 [Thermoprotei archaeon]RLF00946.1 MAG: hypothetical protein DRJ63_00875 [Thermoprotei archaeon]